MIPKRTAPLFRLSLGMFLCLVLLFTVSCTKQSLTELRDDSTSIRVSAEILDGADSVSEKTSEPSERLEDALGKPVLTPEEKRTLGVPSETQKVNTSVDTVDTVDTEAREDVLVKTFVEGEFIKVLPRGYDPDGDQLSYTFTPPLNAHGEWQTKAGDAGTYKVTVSASDGKSVVQRKLVLVVTPTNAPPTLEGLQDLVVQEGDLVTLKPVVQDSEGKQVTVRYSTPLTAEGTWQTDYNDAGSYRVAIVADDGVRQTTKEITIVVEPKNHLPVLKNKDALKEITVVEGETVIVDPETSDLDGDVVKVTFGSPLGSDGTWETSSGDAGEYAVELTLSDGIDEVVETLKIYVDATNHVPQIRSVADLTVQETDLVTVEVEVSDLDGDILTVAFSEPLDDSGQWQTDYGSAGVYPITVTVSDGKTLKAEEFTLTVVNKNRAPAFSFE